MRRFLSAQRLYDLLRKLVEADTVKQDLKIVQNCRLTGIRRLQTQIVLHTRGHDRVVFHIAVHALDDVVARRTERDQFAAKLPRLRQRTHGGKARCELVARHRIHRAAALPIGKLRKLDPKRLKGFAPVDIELLAARFQRAAGKIRKCHIYCLRLLRSSVRDGMPLQIALHRAASPMCFSGRNAR